jgi:chromosome segregation ATPase
MKQIKILMAVLFVCALSVPQNVFAQSKQAEAKEKVEKQERIMEKELKEQKKEMKKEMQEKKEEMKHIKQEHKEEIKEMKEEHKDKMDSMKEYNDDDGSMDDEDQGEKEKMKNKSNNGNAYGKNKKGLEGREFGQARAAEAKDKIEKHERKISESEVTITNGRTRLAAAMERIQKAKEAKEITEEEYVLRIEKVTKVEKLLVEAEESLKRNRVVVVEQKTKLSTIVEQ